MRVFNRIAGYSESYLRKTKNPPVSLARKHFPRPMKEELLSAMSNGSFTSFLIARYVQNTVQFRKPCKSIYRGAQNCVQNIVKKDPGRARQSR